MKKLNNLLLVVVGANFFFQIFVDNDWIGDIVSVITLIVVVCILYLKRKQLKP
ncbi:hypothetical protein SAMN05444162_1989 [Paenibacillaceae bacterium GAS479]|nr:hypothetical protein SAMN05444162_1989 [Paenibacillaceae bacterium GAS479]